MGCRDWINQFCDMDATDMTWEEICCPEDQGEPTPVRCALVLDPCQLDKGSTVSSCKSLVCGLESDDPECTCRYFDSL